MEDFHMKTFCRIMSALLVSLMLLAALAACSSTPTKPAGNGGDTSDVPTDHPEINERFDGETVNFYVTAEGLNSRSIDLGDEDDPSYEVNAQVKKRNEQVKQELGVDIVLLKVGPMQGAYEELSPILSGDMYVYDVIGCYQYFDLGLALGDSVGCFYNLLNMPEGVTNYLDLDAPYWSRTLLDTLAYKGVAFYVTGDLSQAYTGTMFVSYVNSVMWAKFADKIAKLEQSGGYSDVYDIVNNGYWTLDLWIELAKMCYLDDGDEEMDYEDQCGFMTYNQQLNNIMVDMLVAGSNVRFGGLDSEGTPTIEIYSKRNNEFYNKLYTLLCESKTVTIPWIGGADGEEGTYIMDIFAGGKVLLNVNTLAQAEEYLADMKDDFYVMPLPMLSRDQFNANSASKGYTTQLGDSVSQYAICTSIGDDKVPAVTATLELMAYYSMKWVTPSYYETALKERYTRDPKNAEMIDMIKAGIYTDFAFIWSSELGNITWNLRSQYNEGTKVDNNLRSWDRNATGLLTNKLLPRIEEAFYVEK
jgi:hypothetical protein